VIEKVRGEKPHRGQVFGPLVEREGVTLVPVVRVRRSGTARAIGAWVIKDGTAEWQPAFDLTAVIVTSNAVAVVALIVLRGLFRRAGDVKRPEPR